MQSFPVRCFFALALCFSLSALVAPSAAAQQPDDEALVQPDMFLIELRRRARGNDVQRAESIRDALRLRLDDEASGFLELLAGREMTDAQRARMVDIISAERLLRATVSEMFSDVARQQAAQLLDARRRLDEDTGRIAASIAAIGTGDPEQELPAYRNLLAAGAASVGPLAVAAAQEPDARRRDALLRVLAQFGEESIEALSQLALYGSENLRGGALLAIERLRGEAALPYLGVAAHAPGATAAERQLAIDRLRIRYGQVPRHQEVQQFLLDRLSQLRTAAGRLARSEATALSWILVPQEDILTPTTTTAGLAAQRRVADMSRLLHRLGGLSAEAKRAAFTADLAYRFQLDPLGVFQQADELRSLWGEDALHAGSLSAVLADALAEDDLAAAVAVMSLIDASTEGDSADLMTTRSPLLSPLVQAVQHSVPQVRYEAAAAIGRLQFKAPYPGSSAVLKRWIEMLTLSRQPTALIVESRAGLEAHTERLITALGYRVEVVSSVAEAIAELDRGGDIRMLIATTILPDRSVLELVDAVRRHPFGLRVPIFIHGPHDDSTYAATEQPRWSAPVIHLELPASSIGWSIELDPLMNQPLGRLQGLEPLSPVERFDFRRQAAETIGHLSSYPELYHFYDFRLLGEASVAAGQVETGEVVNVAFGDPRLAVLSVSASGQSQAALVDLLLRSSATPERYRAIGEALLHSIERNGVLLSGDVLGRLGDAGRSLGEGPQRSVITDVMETIARRFGAIPTEAGEG